MARHRSVRFWQVGVTSGKERNRKKNERTFVAEAAEAKRHRSRNDNHNHVDVAEAGAADTLQQCARKLSVEELLECPKQKGDVLGGVLVQPKVSFALLSAQGE